ncbi:MAG: hypothetical protein U1E23_12060 [Reyranellaceae bacterium]
MAKAKSSNPALEAAVRRMLTATPQPKPAAKAPAKPKAKAKKPGKK